MGKRNRGLSTMKIKKRIITAISGAFWTGVMTVNAAPVILFDGLAEKGSIEGWANVGSTGPQRIGAGGSYEYTDLAFSTTVPKWTTGNQPAHLFSDSGARYDAGIRKLAKPPAYVRGQDIYAGYYLKWENVSSDTVAVNNLSIPLVFAPNPEGDSLAHLHILGVVAPAENQEFIHRTVNFSLLFKTGTPGQYRFDQDSYLKANVRAFSSSVGKYTNRWVLVAGGVTYLSETVVTAAMTQNFTDYTLNNPDEIHWAVWNPGREMSFGGLTFDVAGSTIMGITHAGIAENNVVRAGEKQERRIYLAGFEANLKSVPDAASK